MAAQKAAIFNQKIKEIPRVKPPAVAIPIPSPFKRFFILSSTDMLFVNMQQPIPKQPIAVAVIRVFLR